MVESNKFNSLVWSVCTAVQRANDEPWTEETSSHHRGGSRAIEVPLTLTLRIRGSAWAPTASQGDRKTVIFHIPSWRETGC